MVGEAYFENGEMWLPVVDLDKTKPFKIPRDRRGGTFKSPLSEGLQKVYDH